MHLRPSEGRVRPFRQGAGLVITCSLWGHKSGSLAGPGRVGNVFFMSASDEAALMGQMLSPAGDASSHHPSPGLPSIRTQ